MVKAVSLAEKKAESPKKKTKRKISPGVGAWDWARARAMELKGRRKSHRLGGLSIYLGPLYTKERGPARSPPLTGM